MVSDAVFNYFDAHFTRKYLEATKATAIAATTTQGKTDADDDDDNSDSTEFGLDIDEEALIASKTNFERKSILKHRSLFSETLSSDIYIKAPPMHIAIKGSPDSRMDPSLYCYKP